MQFLDLKSPYRDRDDAAVVLVPVPFDGTTCYRAGARDGPAHILAASPHMEFYDEETGAEPFKKGIHTLAPVEPVLPPEALAKNVRDLVEGILRDGKLAVTLGGEHSVSIGAIQAAHRVHGPLNIIHFDAHADLRDSYLGSPYSHACVMRRVWDLGNIIQVGIRSISAEDRDFLAGQGSAPINARHVIADRTSALHALASRIRDLPTYVTIDLDCLDPSIMPAVGTPEPGGLSWTDITAFLRLISGSCRVVAFDVVELAPIPGLHAADFLAARLVYQFLAYLLSR